MALPGLTEQSRNHSLESIVMDSCQRRKRRRVFVVKDKSQTHRRLNRLALKKFPDQVQGALHRGIDAFVHGQGSHFTQVERLPFGGDDHPGLIKAVELLDRL